MWWPAVVKYEWEWPVPTQTYYVLSPHAYVNQRLQIQLELLMMSGIPLETCWAFNERRKNKFCYKVAPCWLFLLNHTTMHGSMNIKFARSCFVQKSTDVLHVQIEVILRIIKKIKLLIKWYLQTKSMTAIRSGHVPHRYERRIGTFCMGPVSPNYTSELFMWMVQWFWQWLTFTLFNTKCHSMALYMAQ